MKGLDDLCVRFIINLPLEELSTPERICFQIEEAQWFYEDFIRPTDPDLPSLNLRNFTAIMFQHCPLLKGWSSEQQAQAFQAFLDYKTTVPVRGAILLNHDMDEVVLVRGWKKGANWSFPRGKIDQKEEDLKCAMREVYEETGYDLKASGLVGEEKDAKYIDLQIRGQELKMYVFRGIPMDTHFQPRTRKEISKIQWHKLSDLPTAKPKKHQQQGYGEELAANANKYYMVAPFLGPLKKWIAQQRKRDRAMSANQAKTVASTNTMNVETAALEQESMDERGDDERAQEDHLTRLLHTLRQSSPVGNEPLPELSHPQEAQQSGPSTSTKSADLLALLRGNTGISADQKPQTPINQIVEEPTPPKSPSHPPPPHQASNLLQPAISTPVPQPPSIENIARDPYHHNAPSAGVIPQPPQLRSIPLPTQPPQLAPRGSGLHPRIPPNRQTQQLERHPRDDFPSSPFSSLGHQGSAVPSASKLPLPKLNPQSSALLSLFRESPATMTKTSEDRTQGKLPFAPAKHQDTESPTSLIPPQVTRRPSEKMPQVEKPKAAHQANLLDILRGAPTPNSSTKSLEPPGTAVELSAFPSPGRSRKPSKIEQSVKAIPVPRDEKPFGTVKIQKRTDRTNPSLLATVNGPLNVPQFDMIKTSNREVQAAVQKAGKDQAHTPPIKILSRPSSSHAAPITPAPAPAPHLLSQPLQPNSRSNSLVTTAKVLPPPTPDLRAQNAPPKPFQPQILRRSGAPPEVNEPSPIQPLPSPKHKAISARNDTPQDNHKKSLLSLFTTKPSPAVSPPTTVADTSIDLNSLVSPLEKSSTPSIPKVGRQSSDAFVAPGSVSATNSTPTINPDPPKEKKKFFAPDRMPPPPTSKKDTITAGFDEGRTSGPSRGKHTPEQPQPATTNPGQKEFLLGYLADVVRSGR